MVRIIVKTKRKPSKTETLNELQNPLVVAKNTFSNIYNIVKKNIESHKISRQQKEQMFIRYLESAILTDLCEHSTVQELANSVSQNTKILHSHGTYSVKFNLDKKYFENKILSRILNKQKNWNISVSIVVTLYEYNNIKNRQMVNKLFKTTNNIFYTISISYELFDGRTQRKNVIHATNTETGVPKTELQNLQISYYNIIKQLASRYVPVVLAIQKSIQQRTTGGEINV